MDQKVEGADVSLSMEGAGSTSNTMLSGPRPTSVPSGILIHPVVWPQYTNVTNRTGQDRQWSDRIGRTVLQTAAQKVGKNQMAKTVCCCCCYLIIKHKTAILHYTLQSCPWVLFWPSPIQPTVWPNPSQEKFGPTIQSNPWPNRTNNEVTGILVITFNTK